MTSNITTMMGVKSSKNIDFAGKRVLIRVDFSAPVDKTGEADNFSFISTCARASLEVIEGKILPGFANLDRIEEEL